MLLDSVFELNKRGIVMATGKSGGCERQSLSNSNLDRCGEAMAKQFPTPLCCSKLKIILHLPFGGREGRWERERETE